MTLPTDDKARKALPVFTGVVLYFPDALLAVAEVSRIGNDQHNPGEPLHWARGKSMNQMDTSMRHQMDHGTGTLKDTDGAWHLAKAIWRLCAELQLTIERETAHAQAQEAKRESGGLIGKNESRPDMGFLSDAKVEITKFLATPTRAPEPTFRWVDEPPVKKPVGLEKGP